MNMPAEGKIFTSFFHPLLSTVDILYLSSEGYSETYTLKVEGGGNKSYLRIWCNRVGFPSDINACALPFTYDELCEVLSGLPEAHGISAILERDSIKKLRALGFTLEQLIAVSRFTTYNYPLNYLIILASHWKIRTETAFCITRQLLTEYLGLEETLTHGQMQALRKLSDVEGDTPTLLQAIRVVVNKWKIIKNRIGGTEVIDARILILMARISDLVDNDTPKEVLQYSHIFSWYASVSRRDMDILGNWADIYARTFCVQWIFLQFLSNGARVSRVRDLDILVSEAVLQLTSENSPLQAEHIKQAVLEKLSGRFSKQYLELYEYMMINHSPMDPSYTNEQLLPHDGRLTANNFFKPVNTVGELRLISQRLHNCAKNRLHHYVENSDIELWQYEYKSSDDKVSDELALLELQWMPDGNCVINEFKGYRNARVSQEAIERYYAWIKNIIQANNDATHVVA